MASRDTHYLAIAGVLAVGYFIWKSSAAGQAAAAQQQTAAGQQPALSPLGGLSNGFNNILGDIGRIGGGGGAGGGSGFGNTSLNNSGAAGTQMIAYSPGASAAYSPVSQGALSVPPTAGSFSPSLSA